MPAAGGKGKGKDLMFLPTKLGASMFPPVASDGINAAEPTRKSRRAPKPKSVRRSIKPKAPMIDASDQEAPNENIGVNTSSFDTSSSSSGGSSSSSDVVPAAAVARGGVHISSGASGGGGGGGSKQVGAPSSHADTKREADIRNMVEQIKSRNTNNGGGRQAKGGPWMAEEDQYLRNMVDRDDAGKWKEKAARLNALMAPYYANLASEAAARGEEVVEHGRVAAQCMHRWKKVLQPGLNKGHWLAADDEKIRGAVASARATGVAVKWSTVARDIDGRLGKQCRERWFNHLDPTVKKTGWTSHEDEVLFNAQIFFNTRWCEISKLLPGRTENAVKNRFNSSARQKWESSALGAAADRGSSRLFLEKLKRTLGDTEIARKKGNMNVKEAGKGNGEGKLGGRGCLVQLVDSRGSSGKARRGQRGNLADGAVGRNDKSKIFAHPVTVKVGANNGESSPATNASGCSSKKRTAGREKAGGKRSREQGRVGGGASAAEVGRVKGQFGQMVEPIVVKHGGTLHRGEEVAGGRDVGDIAGVGGEGCRVGGSIKRVAVRGRAKHSRSKADRAHKKRNINTVTDEDSLDYGGLGSSPSSWHSSHRRLQRQRTTYSSSEAPSTTANTASDSMLPQLSQTVNTQERGGSMKRSHTTKTTPAANSCALQISNGYNTDMYECRVDDANAALLPFPLEMFSSESAATEDGSGLDSQPFDLATGAAGSAEVSSAWSAVDVLNTGMQDLVQTPALIQNNKDTQEPFAGGVTGNPMLNNSPSAFECAINSIDGAKAWTPLPVIMNDISGYPCHPKMFLPLEPEIPVVPHARVGVDDNGGDDDLWRWSELCSSPSGLDSSPVDTFVAHSASDNDRAGPMNVITNSCSSPISIVDSDMLITEEPGRDTGGAGAPSAAAHSDLHAESELLFDRDAQPAPGATAASPFYFDTPLMIPPALGGDRGCLASGVMPCGL